MIFQTNFWHQFPKPQSIISLLIRVFIILTQTIGNVSPISRGFRNNHFPVAKMVQKTHPKIPNNSSPQDQDLGISCYRTSILQPFPECELWHNLRVWQVASFRKSCAVLNFCKHKLRASFREDFKICGIQMAQLKNGCNSCFQLFQSMSLCTIWD